MATWDNVYNYYLPLGYRRPSSQNGKNNFLFALSMEKFKLHRCKHQWLLQIFMGSIHTIPVDSAEFIIAPPGCADSVQKVNCTLIPVRIFINKFGGEIMGSCPPRFIEFRQRFHYFVTNVSGHWVIFQGGLRASEIGKSKLKRARKLNKTRDQSRIGNYQVYT